MRRPCDRDHNCGISDTEISISFHCITGLKNNKGREGPSCCLPSSISSSPSTMRFGISRKPSSPAVTPRPVPLLTNRRPTRHWPCAAILHTVSARAAGLLASRQHISRSVAVNELSGHARLRRSSQRSHGIQHNSIRGGPTNEPWRALDFDHRAFSTCCPPITSQFPLHTIIAGAHILEGAARHARAFAILRRQIPILTTATVAMS